MQSQFNENSLQVEILAEKATAYFATIRKMEAALATLRNFDALPKVGSSSEHQKHREQLAARAAEKVWFFIIQREALKLPVYEELFSEFDIPDEIRLRMGSNSVPRAWSASIMA